MGRIGSLILIIALFVGAVLAAGATVTTSYQLAKLDQREKAALAKQRILKEEYAQASSLQTVLRYARTEGFIQVGEASTLSLSPSLAQR